MSQVNSVLLFRFQPTKPCENVSALKSDFTVEHVAGVVGVAVDGLDRVWISELHQNHDDTNNVVSPRPRAGALKYFQDGLLSKVSLVIAPAFP